MLRYEEKKTDVNLSTQNILRLATPNTHQETETTPEVSNNQLLFFNRINTEKDITYNNKNINENNNIKKKRIDRNGNLICKNGKHKITFIDKITNKNFTDIINVESFKKYNKIEEVSCVSDNHGCCIII
jgi:hypothetical protein